MAGNRSDMKVQNTTQRRFNLPLIEPPAESPPGTKSFGGGTAFIDGGASSDWPDWYVASLRANHKGWAIRLGADGVISGGKAERGSPEDRARQATDRAREADTARREAESKAEAEASRAEAEASRATNLEAKVADLEAKLAERAKADAEASRAAATDEKKTEKGSSKKS